MVPGQRRYDDAISLTTRALIPALVLLLTVQATVGLAVTPAPKDASAADHRTESALGHEYAQVEHGEAAASGSATASDADDDGTAARNVTRLYVDAEDPYLRLEPGATGTYTVTVRNQEDEAVTLDSHVASPAIDGPSVPDDWVTVEVWHEPSSPIETTAPSMRRRQI